MKNLFFLTLLALSVLFTGCASSTQQSEPPSINISKDVPLSRIKSAIIDTGMATGWQLERESDYLMTFVKENTNMLVGALFHTNYDIRVFNRASFVITDSGNYYTLRMSMAIVSNYGSPLEKSESVRAKNVAETFEKIEAKLR